MSTSGDAAEQIVRMSFEGMEVVAKITGTCAKEAAILLAALLKDSQKMQGKTTLKNMIRSGKELTLFSVKAEDIERFAEEAKRYGVLYTIIKDKGQIDDGVIDIVSRAEDAPKINRIMERFRMRSGAVKDPNPVRTAGGSPFVKDLMEKTRSGGDFTREKRPSVRKKLSALKRSNLRTNSAEERTAAKER